MSDGNSKRAPSTIMAAVEPAERPAQPSSKESWAESAR